MTNSDCRLLLRLALSQINVACPPGLFVWLQEAHPRFHEDLFSVLATRIDLAWEKPQFEAVLHDFLYAVSVAKAMFELSGKDGRGAIEC
jgi:hypothetical protein